MNGADTMVRPTWFRGWYLVVAAWLVAFAARPLILGFYHDDWALLVAAIHESAGPFGARFDFFRERKGERKGTSLIIEERKGGVKGRAYNFFGRKRGHH